MEILKTLHSHVVNNHTSWGWVNDLVVNTFIIPGMGILIYNEISYLRMVMLHSFFAGEFPVDEDSSKGFYHISYRVDLYPRRAGDLGFAETLSVEYENIRQSTSPFYLIFKVKFFDPVEEYFG